MVLKTICSDYLDQPSQSGWVITTDQTKRDRMISCQELLNLEEIGKGGKHHKNKENRSNKPNRKNADIVIGASNPTSRIFVPDVATAATVTFIPATITGWTLNTADVSRSFNAATGIFTAPCAGDYEVELVLSYIISEIVVSGTNNSGAINLPYVELFDVNSNSRIAAATLNLGDRIGQLIINKILHLKAGQKIAFRVNPNGFVVQSNAKRNDTVLSFNSPLHNTTLSIVKVRNHNN